MTQSKHQAKLEFQRMVKWISIAAALMVVGALGFLFSMDALTIHAAVATVLGVFVSVVLGCGLFALAFFSDKSGHDENVNSATTRQDRDKPE